MCNSLHSNLYLIQGLIKEAVDEIFMLLSEIQFIEN